MSTEPARRASMGPASKGLASKTKRNGVRKDAPSGTFAKKATRSGGAPARASKNASPHSAGEATGAAKDRRAGATTTKVSVTVPTELLTEVRRLGTDNLSAVVGEALRQWSASARLGRMLDELDAIYGPVPADVAAEVEATWGPIFDRAQGRKG